MSSSMGEIDHLLAARETLESSLQKSKELATAVDGSGSRLRETGRSLARLHAAIKDIACKCAVYKIRDHIDGAIGPCAAVVRVLDLVYELQDSLEIDPRAVGLFVYLTNIERLREALKLLADNCRLVALWLEDDVARILKNGDERYLVRVSRVMKILEELQGEGESREVLSSALNKLEHEYERILTESRMIFHQDYYYSSFPAIHTIEELQGIVEVLAANDRLERCVSIHAETRIADARAVLRALNPEYVDIKLSEAVGVQTVEAYIDQWDSHLEFAARHLLRKERRLCIEVYGDKIGPTNCFAKIAARCGFTEILDFGSKICRCKKEAIKLLRLLKIFSTLDKLRLEFNDLFGDCVEIQNRIRDLVRRVVDGTCEIFWELSVQVELQRACNPPPDGRVPRLVRFVTEYCDHLLEDENRLILVRVLEIDRIWNKSNNNRAKYEKGLLGFEIHNIMNAVEINLETWARSYDDVALSYLFTMNNHCYLRNKLRRGTKLGELMGDSWRRAYEESSEYYAALYVKESWGKIRVLLREEGLFLFPGGRAVDRDLAKKRIRSFCEAFDDTYEKQSEWVLSNEGLRRKTCRLIVEAVVMPYRRYLQRFMHGMEHEIEVGTHTAERLEDLIGSMFRGNLLGGKL